MQTKVCGLIVLLSVSISTAQAQCSKWEKLSESGQKALDSGNFKRAEPIWVRAVKEAKNCGDTDPSALGTSLKRLGEVYMKTSKFPLAESTLKQAADQLKTAGKEDADLSADLAELGKSYRSIDFINDVKPAVADFFKQAGVNSIGILRLAQDQGSRIVMNLGKKFTQKIDNPDVDHVGLDKVVSFDIVQEPDGALMISKIKGLKVRAKLWATIVKSHVKPKEAEPSAEVTAQAMGISKTVSCKLPSDVIDPINIFVAKINDFTGGQSSPAPTTQTPTNPSSTTATNPSATTQTSPAATTQTPTNPSSTPANPTTTTPSSTTSTTTDAKPFNSHE